MGQGRCEAANPASSKNTEGRWILAIGDSHGGSFDPTIDLGASEHEIAVCVGEMANSHCLKAGESRYLSLWLRKT
jgi:hypothetical protein